jgi:cytochrome c
MKFRISVVALAALAVAPAAFAEGDPASGEAVFGRVCVQCHHVINDDGDLLAGRANVRTGPNLYAVVGRQAGSVEGFRYGPSIVEAGNGGLIWDEESLVGYIPRATDFLKEVTGNARARGNMANQRVSEDEARDIVAYLVSLAPGEEEEEAPATN